MGRLPQPFATWDEYTAAMEAEAVTAIPAIPAIPEPWVFDEQGLRKGTDGLWRFTIRCDEGSTIASGPRAPKIEGFECTFVGHTPNWTRYSYKEVV